jgi:TPR repeat protein
MKYSSSSMRFVKPSSLWLQRAMYGLCVSASVFVWQGVSTDAYAQEADASAMIQAMETAGFQGDAVTFDNNRKALEALNTPEAYSKLAELYQSLPAKDMQRVEEPKTAALYFQKAIDVGTARNMRDDAWRKAYVSLAMMYRRGDGIEKSETKAVELLKAAMDAGHGGAAFQYGRMLETGFDDTKGDAKAAAEVYKKAVTMKSGDAALALARMYRLGVLTGEGADAAQRMTAQAITLMRESSDKGNGMAAYQVGYLYEMGEGVEKDFGEALKWYDKGAKLGAPAALAAAARLYGQGAGGSNNIQKATVYMRRAAQAGSVNAALELGESLFSGSGYYIAISKDEALSWLKRAAEANNSRAMNRLAEWYIKTGNAEAALPYLQKAAERSTFTAFYSMYRIYSGVGKEGVLDIPKAKSTFENALALKQLKPEERMKLLYLMLSPEEPVFDAKRALGLLLPMAKEGSVLAMDALADAYEKGVFGQADFAQALTWRTKAADKGDVSSMLSLAAAYRDGIGTKKDLKQYEAYLNKALANVSATDYRIMTKIGRMFKLSTEGTHDNQKALYWFERAAKGGDSVGQLEFGRIVILGGVNGYTQEQAIAMFEAAAGVGSRDAMLELGRAYAAGRGVHVDVRESAKYFLRAAAKGQMEAMRQAGILLIQGRGAVKDVAGGLQWLQQAVAAGNTMAFLDLGAYYLYANPAGVDAAKAAQYWQKAAVAGLSDGQYLYGLALFEGHGVAKNVEQAKVWFKKSAEAGNRLAKYKMAILEPQAKAVVPAPVIEETEDAENIPEQGDVVPSSSPQAQPAH